MNNIAMEITCPEYLIVNDYLHCRKFVCVSVAHTMKDHPSFNGSSTNNYHLFSLKTWDYSSDSERHSVIITHRCLYHTQEGSYPCSLFDVFQFKFHLNNQMCNQIETTGEQFHWEYMQLVSVI